MIFNNRLDTILSELTQNARRAGATHLDVNVTPTINGRGRMTIHDNGKGIPAEKFQTLLEFGGSGWNDLTEAVETPAGMGIFSLSHRNPAISSSGLFTHLTKEVFCGKETAPVLPCETNQGTTISFDITPDEILAESNIFTRDTHMRKFETALRTMARFCPLSVSLNGEKLPQNTFGEGAIHSFKTHGATIYIFRKHDQREIKSYICPSEKKTLTIEESAQIASEKINFFGQIIPFLLGTETDRKSGAKIYNLADMAQNPNAEPPQLAPLFTFSKPMVYTIAIDIENTSYLKPKLPDRQDIVNNGAIDEIFALARQEIYKLIAKHRHNLIPYDCYVEARAAGINIPRPITTGTLDTLDGKKVYLNPDEKLPEEGMVYITEDAFPRCHFRQDSITSAILETAASRRTEFNTACFVPLTLAKKNDNVICTFRVRITDSLGTTHISDPLFQNVLTDTFNPFIDNIFTSNGAIVSSIQIIGYNTKKQDIFWSETDFITQMDDDYFDPEEHLCLFTRNVKSSADAFALVKNTLYSSDTYGDTRYGWCDGQTAEEGEHLFDENLTEFLSVHVMNSQDIEETFRDMISEALRNCLGNMPKRIRDAGKSFEVSVSYDKKTCCSNVKVRKMKPFEDTSKKQENN